MTIKVFFGTNDLHGKPLRIRAAFAHSMRLNATESLLTDVDYPVTNETMIEQHGNRSLELADGTESLETVLLRLGPETYENADELRAALFTGVSQDAIGRRFYSDRDQHAPGEYGPDQLSF